MFIVALARARLGLGFSGAARMDQAVRSSIGAESKGQVGSLDSSYPIDILGGHVTGPFVRIIIAVIERETDDSRKTDDHVGALFEHLGFGLGLPARDLLPLGFEFGHLRKLAAPPENGT